MHKPPLPSRSTREQRPRFRIDEAQGIALEFPQGIPGFEELHRYHLYDLLDYPHFAFLISDEENQVAMILLDSSVLAHRITVKVPREKLAQVCLAADAESGIFLILRLHHNLGQLTANLRAPLVISTNQRTGYQIILDDDALPISYPLLTNDSPSGASFGGKEENDLHSLKGARRGASREES